MAQRSRTTGLRKKAATKSGRKSSVKIGAKATADKRAKPAGKKVTSKEASAKRASGKAAGEPRTPQNTYEGKNVIRIKGFRKEQFNLDRPLKGNSLLLNQLEHFQKMEQRYPEHLRTGIALDKVKTEGQASEYIRRVTLLIQSPFHKEAERKVKKA